MMREESQQIKALLGPTYCRRAAITFCASVSMFAALGKFSTAFCTSGSSAN